MIYYILSASSVEEFATCEQKFAYHRVHRIAPIGFNIKMETGTVGHKGLEYYYKAIQKGFSFSRAQEVCLQAGRMAAIKSNLSIEDSEIIISALKEYTIAYIGETWKILGVSEKFSKIIYEDKDEDFGIAVEGETDLRVINTQNIELIVDHKFKFSNRRTSPLSFQFMLYPLIFGKYHLVENIVTINQQPIEKRLERRTHTYTPDKLAEFKANLIHWALRMKESEELNDFSRNYTSCDKYGGCAFRPLCEAPPKVRDTIIGMKFQRREDRFDLFQQKDNSELDALLEDKEEKNNV